KVPQRTSSRRHVQCNKPTGADCCNAFSSFKNILWKQSKQAYERARNPRKKKIRKTESSSHGEFILV
ncbi:unnamed protein product, partial [Ilex paraguariensis]